MTDTEMQPLLAWLSAMPSAQGWNNAHRQIYGMILGPVRAEIGRAAVIEAVQTEEWRPSPARLRRILVRLLSPSPGEEATYGEICYKAERFGLYGRRTAPNWYEEGAPTMSHPVVGLTIAYCGGWRAICTGEAQKQEGLHKQVHSGHAAAEAQWTERVLGGLQMPPETRDRDVFDAADPTRLREYPVYRLPAGFVAPVYEGESVEALRREKLEPVRSARDGDVPLLLAGLRANEAAHLPSEIGRSIPDQRQVEEAKRARQTERRQELRAQALDLVAQATGQKGAGA